MNEDVSQPRDPSNVEEGIKTSTFIIVLGILFFLFGGMVVFLFLNQKDEDKREVRYYDGLTCIYNVSDDEIEECN